MANRNTFSFTLKKAKKTLTRSNTQLPIKPQVVFNGQSFVPLHGQGIVNFDTTEKCLIGPPKVDLTPSFRSYQHHTSEPERPQTTLFADECTISHPVRIIVACVVHIFQLIESVTQCFEALRHRL